MTVSVEAGGSILVVDANDAWVSQTVSTLRAVGLRVDALTTPHQLRDRLDAGGYDVLVLEMDAQGEAHALVRHLETRWPDLAVILLAANVDVGDVVGAVNAGAADLLKKPVSPEELTFAVTKVLRARERELREPPPASVVVPGGGDSMIGVSPSLRDVLTLVERAARSNATVLVRGESGSGKELVARRVHDLSSRQAGPFVKVHCAALPDQLLESELFGYEKGAFTGATSRKPGRIELADRGTLFLDEIGDITPATQVKLLRVLQDKQYERLGGTQTLDADVRFVAATHKPLERMVRDGEFREDLYYRLNVIPIVVPPLRDRPDDIEPLVRHFARVTSLTHERRPVEFPPASLELLRRHDWPGNVRQLENFVERLIVLCERDVIAPGIVHRELERQSQGIDGLSVAVMEATANTVGSGLTELSEVVRQAEKRALRKALKKANDNRTLAAKILGVSRRTLYNKLEEHGL